jgi:hypothetical protein
MKPSELLSQPGAWCQGTFAVALDGRAVSSTSKAACQWCLLGAVNHCLKSGRERDKAIDDIGWKVGNGIIWNDAPGRTQFEVVTLLQSVGL